MKTGPCNQSSILAATAPIFALKKTRMAKDILDKNVFNTSTLTAGIPIIAITALAI